MRPYSMPHDRSRLDIDLGWCLRYNNSGWPVPMEGFTVEERVRCRGDNIRLMGWRVRVKMRISVWVFLSLWVLLCISTGAAQGQGVQISEVMYHPYHPASGAEDSRQEWIELYNGGPGPVDLGGWSLADGVDYVFPDVVVEAGGYLVVAADVNVFAAKYPDVKNVVGGWTGWLSNTGETIALADTNGAVIDAVSYADEGDWSVRELGPLDRSQRGWQWSDGHDGGGKSLELVNPTLPNEFGPNWAASLTDGGTPGRANSIFATDIAPLVLHVTQTPIIPGPNDPVTVTARVVDEATGGLTVVLHWRLDSSTYADQNVYPQYNSADYNDLPMLDGGTHGDEQANDGVFGAVIPAQPNGRVVEFFVEARDAGGKARTWPAPSVVDGAPQQVTNALYQVDGSFDSTRPWAPADQPLYLLVMTEAERARLADIGNGTGGPGSEDDSDSAAHMNGTFISVDGTGVELRYEVGIRNRGKGSRSNAGGAYRNNYRVDFTSEQPWKGVTAINIKARYGYVAALGSAVWRMANLPAERITPVRVHVNGQDLAFNNDRMFGSYATVEVIDSEFVARHFPGDREGNAYRCMNDTADLSYRGTNRNNYRTPYEKQTNVAANDYNDIVRLTYVLNNTPAENLVEEARKVVRLDQWLRFLAVDALCGNREGGLTTPRGDDYAMYRGTLDTRFWLIPHDLDTLFGQGDTGADISRDIHVYAGLAGLHELLAHPDVLPLYHAQFLDLIDTVFSPQQFDPLVDQVLGGFVPEQTRTRIKQFVAQRNAAVLAQIPRQLTMTSTLPVANGYARTTESTFTLTGTANAARARSVLVNGVPAVWSAQDGTWRSGQGFGAAESLVSAGSEWKYLDDGSDQGMVWQSAGFDDSTWRSGRAELGYGDGGEVTTINSGPAASRFITTYFRRSFTATNVSEYVTLNLRLLRDDGAVVYLNGAEVCRSNMPQGAVSYDTRASAGLSGAEESTFVDYELSPTLLREGENLLAVEIHQNAPSSSDVSFDLGLEAVRQSVQEGSLQPGINRIIVQSFDGRDGAGTPVEEGYFDIWYDSGGGSEISGTLASDKVLDAASGPWHVTGTLTVPAGRTLTIEPGTTLFFEPGTGIVVNGLLIAEGSVYQRITLTKVPGSGNWAGLQFLEVSAEGRLAYVDMEYCDSGSCAVRADHARVSMDHVIWANHTKQYLTFDDASMVLKNSVLPSLKGAELLHFWGFPADGYALIEGNWFGSTSGYNDIIDLTGGQRPGPIARFINNVFTGASDDCIDLDASDAHVEGNVFMHMHQDGPRESLSHAVSTGTEYNQYSEVTAVRNLFYDVDHAFLSKDGGFITAVNNTVAHVTRAAVNMYEARSGQWQGKGFYGDGNIFCDVAHMFENPDWTGHATAITMNNSIFPTIEGDPIIWAGVGNLENVDPQLVKAVSITDPVHDMRLLPASPARGAGPNGKDIGGLVSAGASISGEPLPVTWRTSATLAVGGPEIFGYRYRVNDGPWSQEVLRPDAAAPADPKPLAPIQLANLENGQSYTVYVIGKDSAGVWQDANQPTTSRTWTVDTSYRHLVINEVLAVNQSAFEHQGAFPDMVELYYDGPAAMGLAGMSLSDDPDRPTKFVFPGGAIINPGQYVVLYADKKTTGSGYHLPFSLSADGDGVYLYDKAGALIDSVEFGMQVPDLSVGRIGDTALWHLTVPTLGQPNISHPLGDSRAVRINEWLATHDVLFTSDFVELYNPDLLPVDLGGFYLTDTPETEPDRHRLPPLSFVPGGGYTVFAADDHVKPGHLGFKLSPGGDMIALFDAAFNRIDEVIFGPQTRDVSQGRSPDGENEFAYFPVPTPGEANPGEKKITTTVTMVLVEEKADKRVLVPAGSVSDDWQGGKPFDDSTWTLCTGAPGGVGFERGQGYDSLITLDTESQMYGTGKNNSCYLRVPFTMDAAALAGIKSLTLKARRDDGFVAYLNGKEVARSNFAGTPVWDSHADSSIEAKGQDFDEVIDISANIGELRVGANILAIHAMNSSLTSSDFLISVALDAVVVTSQ